MRLNAADLAAVASGVKAIEEALAASQFTVRRADIVLEFTPEGREGVSVVLGHVAGALVIIAVDEAATTVRSRNAVRE